MWIPSWQNPEPCRLDIFQNMWRSVKSNYCIGKNWFLHFSTSLIRQTFTFPRKKPATLRCTRTATFRMGFEPMRGESLTYMFFRRYRMCRRSPVEALRTSNHRVSGSNPMAIKKIFLFSKFNLFKRFFLIIL